MAGARPVPGPAVPVHHARLQEVGPAGLHEPLPHGARASLPLAPGAKGVEDPIADAVGVGGAAEGRPHGPRADAAAPPGGVGEVVKAEVELLVRAAKAAQEDAEEVPLGPENL